VPLRSGGVAFGSGGEEEGREAGSYAALPSPPEGAQRPAPPEAALRLAPPERSDAASVLDRIASLVDKSLVRQLESEEASGEPRFMMLETIREYALEQLTARPEAAETRRRHAAYYLALAETLRPRIEGPQGPAVLNQFEIEHPNLQVALTWAVDQDDAETGLRLVAGIWKFWWVHRHLAVAREWIERILALPGDVPPVLRIEAHYAAGIMALGQRDYRTGCQHGEEGLALARQINEAYFLPFMLYLLGNSALDQRNFNQAAALYEEALAFIQQRKTDHPLAEHQEAMIRASLGEVHYTQGAYDEAASLIEEARAIWQERGDTWGLGISALHLAMISAAQGRIDQAAALYRESIWHHREVGDTAGLAETIAGLASLRAAQGHPSEAARLFGAAEALWESGGIPSAGKILDDHGPVIGSLRVALDEEAFAAAWAAGRGLTLDEAIAYALASTAPADPQPLRTETLPGPLTRRQREVTALIAHGLTNRQIATTLFIAERTADTHVAHILARLGLRSRAEVAAWAVEHGLAADTSPN
jgi:DNA-binding CsgD family transcriptional regulator